MNTEYSPKSTLALLAKLLEHLTPEEARPDAELLAQAISHALADTFRVWANNEAMTLESVVDATAARLMVLRGFLGQI